jgi:hypothetical protein
MTRRGLVPLSAAALALVLSSPAWADSIDGHWCNAAGTKQMAISGSRLVTGGGKQIDGNYSRHSFSYRAPDTEPSPGSPVSMLLVNENTIRATTGDEPTAEIWHRCEQTS